MTQKIKWDEATKKLFETGVDHGVLYPMNPADGSYPVGVAWNGLTTMTETPSGADATPLYADNIKYLNLIAAEQFGATIEAFTYPSEFGVCDGSVEPTPGVSLGQQGRQAFGLSFRTVIGNDALGNDYGYKLHLLYGCQAAPAERAYGTINDSPAAISFSWTVATTPVPVTGKKPVSVLTIDSTKVDATKLAALEAILYGVDAVDGRMPLPDEVISLMEEAAPSALALSSIAPADDASGVAVTANIVLTFNNKISHESITVATAAGVIVAVARAWDTAHKVLTLDPTVNLASATTFIVTVAGVVDVYAQSLTTEVKNFAT